ncbi:hypothetical protein B0T25DRAFT_479180 [Lasiosphaeria hispida]|uniref:Zn(2)-C6 fungal-type domain-containing protein n=1 Tax=Lasiosphaeria hispida TaxID=260671 RepID=A0AAJ0HIA2_9PEZI|nr:hypothetical protein B0T25DRAFT_479180 [Lasiosphaeria hispida]
MGRRPNAVILQYFERGPKLQDQSNRYPHTCKACGEHFPRGRLDSLTSHLTRKCPAIAEADRVNALFTLSGVNHTSQRAQQNQQNQQAQNQANGAPVDLPMMQREIQRDWTALGVLAEVSRQIDENDRNDDRVKPNVAPSGSSVSNPPLSIPHGAERFEVQQQFTLETPAQSHDNHITKDKRGDLASSPEVERGPTAEERLQEILRAENASSEPTNLSVAAAATARLHPALLDPQLLGEEAAAAAEAATANAIVTVDNNLPLVEEHSSPDDSSVIPTTSAAQPWGEITYATDAFQPGLINDSAAHNARPIAKGGFRLSPTNSAKSRHSRARFNPDRRKEVQEVRKIGACIRCRILRKTCSKGQPCDTCRKVLSPRIWRSGCVRTKFSDELDIYSAGVQIVLAQGHINALKQAVTLSNNGLVIEACHFPDLEARLQLQVLQRDGIQEGDTKPDTSGSDDTPAHLSITMLDSDNQDLPARVEAYMREVLPELIRREPSHFIRITLRTALDIASTTNDELLKKALELWGLVEILDRERQWQICINPGDQNAPAQYIRDGDHPFQTLCLQLAAAGERKAAATSKSLLTGMQRVLQDSKVKIDFSMYLSTMVLLNCVEKSTWAFKAWDQPNLRQMWPLEKDPNTFAQQGYIIADLLRMLLSIRKAIPRTACREADGKLVTEEDDPVIKGYFEAIGLDFAQVKAKQEDTFSPTDPRSCELLFCSTLLLPSTD